MGRNFISGCHKCRTRVYHSRNEESGSLHRFYDKHDECMRENPDNVVTKDDQLQEEPWMRNDEYVDEVMWMNHLGVENVNFKLEKHITVLTVIVIT